MTIGITLKSEFLSSDRLTDRGQCIVAHYRWAEI